jgi:polygalacturonase
VPITHNTCGHGVSIGSYTNGGVSNITVTDCTITTPDGVNKLSTREAKVTITPP